MKFITTKIKRCTALLLVVIMLITQYSSAYAQTRVMSLYNLVETALTMNENVKKTIKPDDQSYVSEDNEPLLADKLIMEENEVSIEKETPSEDESNVMATHNLVETALTMNEDEEKPIIPDAESCVSEDEELLLSDKPILEDNEVSIREATPSEGEKLPDEIGTPSDAAELATMSNALLGEGYKISFYARTDNGWFLLQEQIVEKGGCADPPGPEDLPEYSGYTFRQWNTDYTNVTSQRNI